MGRLRHRPRSASQSWCVGDSRAFVCTHRVVHHQSRASATPPRALQPTAAPRPPGVAPTMMPPSGEQIDIRWGAQRAVVTSVGATLRSYAVNEREVLDGFEADEM